MDNKKKAILVFGGKSFEHDISIITALIVLRKAKSLKYEFLPVYINKNDEWFYYAEDNLNINLFKDFDQKSKKNGFVKTYLKTNQKSLFYKKGLFEKEIKIDAVLNCCHGGEGENGSLTALFECCKIPVSSGSMTAMGICMDKVLSKYVFKGCKLSAIDYFKFTKEEFTINKDIVLDKAEKLGYPLILKPASLGSSIGIKVAKTKEEFEEACKVAVEFDNTILVEKAILDGMTEYNVACLKVGSKTVVSKVDKPIRSEEILSFSDKYVGDSTQKTYGTKKQNLKVGGTKTGGSYNNENPKEFAVIPEKIEKKLQQISKQIYDELGLFGPVRIDFILNKKNKIYLNEINTVPGSLAYYFFVPHFFKNMGQFVDNVLDNSIDFFNKKQTIKKEYITKLI